MKSTRMLHDAGQSIWLDDIGRNLLESGTLKHYIEELSVTGLISNPASFERAIRNSSAYNGPIWQKRKDRKSSEAIFLDLALEELTHAADLFRGVYDRTNGVDGWVSLALSPLLAYDTGRTLAAAKDLFARARRPNVFIEIPGTREGLYAVEEAVFAGVPVNVTLLFSREQYLAAADAYLRGIERRISARLNCDVSSVASVFVNRWDAAVDGGVPEGLKNQLGIAIAKQVFKESRAILNSPSWQVAYNAGARPQRLVWVSTETRDQRDSDILYVRSLAAPLTVNAMPENTLRALAHHSDRGALLRADGGDCEEVLEQFRKAGVDTNALPKQLQDEGVRSLVESWNELMAVIEMKSGVRATMGLR